MRDIAPHHWRRALLRSTAFFAHTAFLIPPLLVGDPALAQQPVGGSVAAGHLSISQQPGKTTVTQSSEKGIVNWQGFSVGKTESVDFIQPGRSSVTLNRVTGTSASNIEGAITATGQVMLINPNGILFNQGAKVDVGGLVATTSNIRDADFLKGDYRFGDPSNNPDARVVNRGTIDIRRGGYAALSAAAVENTGSIDADVGTVVMGGAKTFTLDLHGDKLLSFRIDQPVDAAPAGAEALVDQRGKITATGGRVVLSARAAKGVIDKVVSMSGVVEAQAARMEGGEVVIDGGDAAKVQVSGSVNVSGLSAGQTGGTVKVLGDEVQLVDAASIRAKGDAGGGVVLVGGNYKGSGSERRAQTALVGEAVTLDASAVTAGNGGKVVIWSDQVTRFNGVIAAKGGALAGDGGLVETSGKQDLGVGANAWVDARAAAGKTGSWLLDPLTITVSSGGANGALTGAGGANDVSNTKSIINVRPTAIAASKANITLAASGSVTFVDPITTASGVGVYVRTNTANINNRVTVTNGVFSVRDFATGAGAAALVTFGAAGAISTGTGAIDISATTIRLQGSHSGGSVALGTGSVVLTGASTITSAGAVTINGPLNGAFALTLAGAGTASIGGAIGTTTALASLTANAVRFSTASVRTSGAQSYGGLVILGTNTAFTTANANLAFTAGLDAATGAETLTTAIGSGTTSITGGAGATKALNNLSLATAALGGAINTTGTQNYGVATIASTTTLSTTGGAGIGFTTSLGGSGALTLAAGAGAIMLAPTSGLASLTQSGTGVVTTMGNVVTTGTQYYAGAVALGADTTFSTANGGIEFSGAINGAASMTVSAGTAAISLAAAIGAMTALSSFTSSGDGLVTVSGGRIVTTGAQSYAGGIVLTSNTTISMVSGNATFSGAVNGASVGGQTLTAAGGTGTVSLIGGAGETTALASVTLNNAALGATIGTTGSQSYGAAMLLSDTTLSASAGGITMGAGGLNGAFNLSLVASGTVSLSSGAGGSVALAGFSSAGPILLGGAITTNGTQSYGGAVSLAAASISLASGGSPIIFAGTLDGTTLGGQALSVNAGAGLVTYGDAIGGLTSLASFTSLGSGLSRLNGGRVVTTGAQSYAGGIILATNTTISMASGNATFSGAVNGASVGGQTLTAAGTGTVSLIGGAGETTALASVTLKNTALGATIRTTGTQSYGAAMLLSDTTLSASAGGITMGAGGVNGAYALNMAASGTVSLSNGAGGSVALTGFSSAGPILLGGSITTNGTQSYGGPVSLAAASVSLASGGSPIIFAGAIDGTTLGGQALSVNAGAGLVTYGGAIGGLTSLASFTSLGSGLSRLNGGRVITTGAQSFTGDVTLGASTTVSTTGASLLISGALNAATAGAQSMVLALGAGTVSFGAAVGGGQALGSLQRIGGGSSVLRNVTTTGSQNYGGAVLLNGTLSAGSSIVIGGSLTLLGASALASGSAQSVAGAINGAQALTINAGASSVSLNGAVGALTRLTSLTVLGTGSLTLGGSVFTTGTQRYAGAVNVGGTIAMSTTNAAISIGALNSASTQLTLASGSGAISVAGSVALGGASTLTLSQTTGTTGATINGAITVGTLGISGGTGTIAFNGAVNAGRLSASGGGYALAFLSAGTSSITGTAQTTLTNTGGVTLGSASTSLINVGAGGLVVSGSTVTLSGTLRSAGSAISLGALNLAANSSIEATGGGASGANVTISGAINSASGNRSLTVNQGSGILSLAGAVGGTTSLSDFNVASTTGVAVVNSVRVTGSQSYAGAVRLNGDLIAPGGAFLNGSVTLLAASSVAVSGPTGNLRFGGTINGGHALTLSSGSGSISLTGALGAVTPLASLRITSSGGSLRLPASIATVGTQSYGAPTVLVAATSLSASDSAIGFSGAIDGAQTLTLAAGTGSVSFGGAVGGKTSLTGLTLSSAGAAIFATETKIAGGVVLPSNATTISFNGLTATSLSMPASSMALTLKNATIANTVLLQSTAATMLLGTNQFTKGLRASGPVNLSGTVTSSGRDIQLSSVTLTGSGLIATNGGAIALGAIDGAFGLALDSGAQPVTLRAGIGQITPLAGLEVRGAGQISMAGVNVATAGDQTYQGPAEVGGTLATSGAGTISFASAITLSEDTRFSIGGGRLTLADVEGSGSALSIAGEAGSSVKLAQDLVNVSSFTLSSSGSAQIQGAVRLADGGSIVLEGGGNGAFNFEKSVTAAELTVTAGAYDISIKDASIESPVTFGNSGNLSLSGASSFSGGISHLDGPTRLSGDLRTSGGAVTFAATTLTDTTTIATSNGGASADITLGPTNGPYALSIDAGSTASAMLGEIGATSALSSLSVRAAGANLQSVRTSGDQIYSLLGDGITPPPIRLSGNLSTIDGGAIDLGESMLSLNGATAISTSGSGAISIGGVAGAGQPLTLSAGGALSSSEDISNVSSLKIVKADGATFNGSIAADALTINGGSGTFSFKDVINVSSFTADAGPYSIGFEMNGTSSIAGAVTLKNTGSVLIGPGVLRVEGGLTASAPSLVLNGEIRTLGAAVVLGTTTATGAAIIDTTDGGSTAALSGASITVARIDGINGSPAPVTLIGGTGGSVTLGPVGSTVPIRRLITTGSTLSLAGVTTSGAQSYNGSIALSGGLITTDGGRILSTGTITLTGDSVIDTSLGGGEIALGRIVGGGRSLRLAAGSGSITAGATMNGLSGLSVDSASVASFALVTSTGDVTIAAGVGSAAFARLLTARNVTVAPSVGLITLGNGLTVSGVASFENAGGLSASGTLNATGGLSVAHQMLLSGATTVSTANGVSLGAVDGENSLRIVATGAVSLGPVGSGTRLTTLDVAAGSIRLTGSASTAGGPLSLVAPTVLLDPTVVTRLDSQGGDIQLGAAGGSIASVGGTGSLTLDSGTGDINLRGAITALANLAIVGTDSAATLSTVNVSGDINVDALLGASSLTFTGAVSATSFKTLDPAGGMDQPLVIAFQKDANFNVGGVLTFWNSGGIVTGSLGGDPVTLNNPGGLRVVGPLNNLSGILIRTAGTPITLGEAQVLTGSTIFDTTNAGAVPTGASITLLDSLDSDSVATPRAATFRAGTTGIVSLGGQVGGLTALASLTIDSAAAIFLNGVRTSGGQSYTRNVTSRGDIIVTGSGAIQFATGAQLTLDATQTIAVSGTGAIQLQNIVGNGYGLTLSTTNSGLSVAGTISGVSDLMLSAGGVIALSEAVTVTGALRLQRGSAVTFNKLVAANSISQGAGWTTGLTSFNGGLSAKSLTTASNNSGLVLSGTVSVTDAVTLLNSGGLTLTGSTTFRGGVAYSAGLLRLGGGLTTNNAAATFGSLALTGGSTIATQGGALTIGVLNGPSSLVINAVAGSVTIGSAGATTALSQLTVTGGSITLNGAVSTTGAQTYNSALSVSLNGNLTASAGAITLNANAQLRNNVTLSATGAISMSSVTATPGFNLGLVGGANPVNISGSVALGSGTLTLGAMSTISFAQAATMGALSITGVSSRAIFGNQLTTGTITTTAQNYGLAFNNGVSVTNGASLATFLNTGGLTLGGTSQFAGGLSYAAGTTTLQGTVITSGKAVTLAGVALRANSLIDSTNGGGNLAGAAVTAGPIDGPFGLKLSSGAGTGSVSAAGQTSPLASLYVTSDALTLGAVTTSGLQSYVASSVMLNGALRINTAGSRLRVTGSTTLGAAAGAGTIAITGASGSNDITLGAVNGARAVSVIAAGGLVSLGPMGQTTALSSLSVSASNVTMASANSSGAITVTAPGGVNLGGALTTTGGTASAISLTSAVTLTADGSLTTAGAAIALQSVNGGATPRALTLNSGAGTVSASGAVAGLSSLTLASVGGGAFLGSIGTAGAFTIAGSTGSLSFTGGFAVGSLSVAAGNYGLTLGGSGNVSAGVVDFKNSGALNLGVASNNEMTFADGLTRAGSVSLQGTIRTNGGAILLGATTLTNSTRLVTTGNAKATGAAINIGPVNGTAALFLNAGTTGSVSISGGAGQSTALASLSATAGGGITMGPVRTNGAQSYVGATNVAGLIATTGGALSMAGGETNLTGATTISTAGGELSLASVAGGGHALTLDGGAGFVAIAGSATNLASLKLTNAGGASFGSIDTLGSVTVSAATGTLDFGGGIKASSLSFAGGAYALKLEDLNVASSLSLTNTAAVTFSGDSLIAGGLIRTNGVTAITGRLRSAGQAVTLGSLSVLGASTIDTTNGKANPAGAAITLGAVDGAASLTLIGGASGTVSLTGSVGMTTRLAGLSVQASSITLAGNVMTTGEQTYKGNVSTPTNATVTLKSSGAITLDSISTLAIGSSGSLVIESVGDIALGKVSGGSNSSLSIDQGGGQLTAEGSILGLANFSLLNSSGATFNGMVGNPNPAPGTPETNLRIASSTGTILFKEAVNANKLTTDDSNFSLTLKLGADIVDVTIANSGGVLITLEGVTSFRNGLDGVTAPIVLNGILRTFGGNANIDKITVNDSATIDTKGATGTPDGNIRISSVTGTGSLSLNAYSGSVVIGSIGDSQPFGAISAAGKSLTLNGSATTVGDQIWKGALSLDGNLVTTGGGAITVTGLTTLLGDTTIDSSKGGGAISLAGAIGLGDPRALTLSSGAGTVTLSDALTNLSSLTLNNVGKTNIAKDVSLSGALNISNATESVAFDGTVRTKGLSAGPGSYGLNFAGDVLIESDSPTHLQTTGQVTIGGKFSSDAGLIHDAGPTVFTSDTLTTIAGEVRLGAVTFGNGLMIDTTNLGGNPGGADITLGTVNGTGQLKIVAGAGAVSLGSVGSDSRPDSVLISGGSLQIGDVSTTGTQSYAGNFTLNGALLAGDVAISGTLLVDKGSIASISTKDRGGSIALNQIDGGGVLTLDAGAGSISIAGAIGATTPVGGLTMSGSSVVLPSSIALAGDSAITNGRLRTAGEIKIDSGTLSLVGLSATDLKTSGGGKILIQNADISGNSEFTNAAGVDFSKENAIGGSLTASAPISIVDSLTVGGNVSFSSTFNLNGSLSAEGSISLQGAADLSGSLTARGGLTASQMRANSNFALATEGDVVINALDGPGDVSITAGGLASLRLTTVGAALPLASLQASARIISLNTVVTAGDQNYTSVDGITLTGRLDAGAGSTIATTGGALTLASGDREISLGGASTSGRIILSRVQGPGSLHLIARNGASVLGGGDSIGSLTSDSALTLIVGSVTGNAQTDLQTTVSRSLQYLASGRTSEALTLLSAVSNLPSAGLRTIGTQTYLGEAVFSGAITAGGGVTVTGGSLMTDRTELRSVGGPITLGSLDGVGGSGSITLDAGAGAITLQRVGGIVPLGALSVKAGSGVTLNDNLAAESLLVESSLRLGGDLTIDVSKGLNIGGSVYGANRKLTVNAGTGDVRIAGGVGADGALALLNITQASDVRIGAVTAQQLRVNASGEVSIDTVTTGQTTISASRITGGIFNVDALTLDADLARIQASVGGRSDRSIFNRIIFGRSGVYIINGQDAASILQSISRVSGAERFTQLLSALINSDSSTSEEKEKTAEGGKKDGTAKPLFKIGGGETTRSAASEEPVPGLRGRFPTLANFALW